MSVQVFLSRLADAIRQFGSASDHAAQIVAERDKEVLDAYKARVLAAALECQEEENWCDEGLHAALRALDIEPPKREWEVSVEVKAYQNVVVKVLATSEDEAMRHAGDLRWGDVMEKVTPNGWAHESHEPEEAWLP